MFGIEIFTEKARTWNTKFCFYQNHSLFDVLFCCDSFLNNFHISVLCLNASLVFVSVSEFDPDNWSCRSLNFKGRCNFPELFQFALWRLFDFQKFDFLWTNSAVSHNQFLSCHLWFVNMQTSMNINFPEIWFNSNADYQNISIYNHDK